MLTAALLSILMMTEPAPSAPAPAPESPVAALPAFELLSNGEPPRSPLRLELRVGDVQSVVMEVDVQMKSAIDGRAFPSPKIPGFGVNVQVVVDEALASGGWKYHFEYKSIDVKTTDASPSEMVTKKTDLMSEMIGMHISAEVDALGHRRNLEIQSNITNPLLIRQLESIKRNMSQLAVEFPAEDVGVGARWRSDTAVAQNGISVRQSVVYRLLAREGDSTRIGMTMTQSATQKNASIQNSDGGLMGTLVDLSGDHKGEMQFDFHNVIASKAKITGESVVNMDIEADGRKMKMDMQSSIAVSPRGATVEQHRTA